ncbi:MAG: nucleotidyltransferase domain-containing protein [Negativicutes bacterium]|nr:nucleotidyltransferase domain-containing protein [Negativicutes bacterium]
MHIYAFGSICRGEISVCSDIDLLAIVEGHDSRFDADVYSIYSYNRVREIWKEGNPFAWHLYLESKLVFASDRSNFLRSLGAPTPYRNYVVDCDKFSSLFHDAHTSLKESAASKIFDLSTMFLGMRNIATCFSLGCLAQPDFSRHAALRLGTYSLNIPQEAYQVFERARILCTRGQGCNIELDEIDQALAQVDKVSQWMAKLNREAKNYAARI